MKNFVLTLLLFGFSSGIGFGQAVEEKPKSKDNPKVESKDPANQDQQKDEQPKPENQAEESKEQEPNPPVQEAKKRRQNKGLQFTKQNEEFVGVFKSLITSTRDSVVEIRDGKKQVALGTVVEDGLVLTKASELKGDLECILPDGKLVKPSVVGIDPDTDLVLLSVEADGLAAAPFVKDSSTPNVGSWIVTVGQQETPVSIGIVSHEPRAIRNNVPNSAVIGIYPRDRNEGEGVRINQVLDDTPAEKSGLLVNDVITSIDQQKIPNVAALREKLSEYQPGDEIVLEILRGKKEKTIRLTLGKQRVTPMMDRGYRQNQMGSVLSKRRSDFPLALQHDSSLNANECGGPVIDLSGKVVGINIARDGRVSTLVLPNSIVLPVVNKLKTGEFMPGVVNKAKIDRIQKQLAQIDVAIGDLPERKSEKDLELAVGSAVETEIKDQIARLEEQLEQLKKRYSEKRKLNREISDGIKDIGKKLDENQNRRERLEFDLKRLRTGIR